MAAFTPDDVPDVIMQRSVRDIAEKDDFTSIDNMVLVLPCNHLLTVESADGIAGLDNFYAQNAEGKWTHPTAPSQSLPAPRCPSCRHPFFLNRYGRVFKKADIDMSERSLAEYSTHALKIFEERIANFKGVKLEPSVYKSEPVKYDDSKYKRISMNVEVRLAKAFESRKLVDPSLFAKIQKTFGLTPSHGKLWSELAGPSMTLVQGIDKILKEPSPQQVAWDAAFAKLFRAELENGSCREAGARMLARRSLGIPRPCAKQQHSIQAICISVQLRHRLASIAEQLSNASSHAEEKRYWDLLAGTLLHSTIMDCEVARIDAIEATLDRSYYMVSYYCKSG